MRGEETYVHRLSSHALPVVGGQPFVRGGRLFFAATSSLSSAAGPSAAAVGHSPAVLSVLSLWIQDLVGGSPSCPTAGLPSAAVTLSSTTRLTASSAAGGLSLLCLLAFTGRQLVHRPLAFTGRRLSRCLLAFTGRQLVRRLRHRLLRLRRRLVKLLWLVAVAEGRLLAARLRSSSWLHGLVMAILRALCVILSCDEVSSAGVAPLSPWLPPCFVISLVLNKLVCLMQSFLAAVSSSSFIAGALPPAAQVGARPVSPPPPPPDHSASALHSSSLQGLAVLVLGYQQLRSFSASLRGSPRRRDPLCAAAAQSASVWPSSSPALSSGDDKLRRPVAFQRGDVRPSCFCFNCGICLRRQVLVNFVSRHTLAPPGPSSPARGYDKRHPAGQLLRPSTVFLGPRLLFSGL
jgi:hypothetical protein